MKKLFYLFLSIITYLVLLFPTPASAHMIGQQPYFKVNGTFTDFYPVPSTSLADFKLPQDIVKSNFLVNQSADFEIDINALPVPAEVVQKTKFSWDFADGTPKATGLKNSHAYSKPGTYFLEIYADSGEGFEPQLLQSTAINVLPDKNYQLPKAVIEINGKQTKDPLLDIIDVNFTKEINFEGSKSSGGSSEISEYFWDLGDQNSKTDISFKYQYKENPYTVFPLLRIRTKDGFITDAFIQIKDEGAFTEKPAGVVGAVTSGSGLSWPLIAGGIVGSLILAGILTWIISRFFFKK